MTKLIQPRPPIAAEELPHIGTGLLFLDGPTAYLEHLRARHGDSFFIDIFGFPLLFLFSPKGLESLYALEESKASFGMATFDMIGFKTPLEVFMDADIDLFYKLLAHKNMPAYVELIDRIVQQELERWGEEGSIDLFDAIRTLEQRVGYALWICPLAASDAYWPKLKRHFDVLDQERAFVDPSSVLETIRSNKSRERESIAAIGDLLNEILALHDQSADAGSATVDTLREMFDGPDPEITQRKVLHNILNANQGFLSNLYAGIAWTIYHIAARPGVNAGVLNELETTLSRCAAEDLAKVETLNAMTYLEQVFMESVRMAQRSLTLRKVLQPIEVATETTHYTVEPGVYIATMLSVTNTQTDALCQFDPEHYTANRLSGELCPEGKETVSTFGHGKHACPAQRFSHHMCKLVVSSMLQRFTLELQSGEAEASHKQMGGVSRAQSTVSISYRRRQ